jgi:hypothetical protein
MVRAAIVADEEALVVVRARGLVHGGGALHALVHGQVADVVLVDAQRPLVVERHRVEFARGLERRVDHVRAHAVAGNVEEADLLAGPADLGCDALAAAGLAAKGGADVDHGNRLRRLRDIAHGHRLEDTHSGSRS